MAAAATMEAAEATDEPEQQHQWKFTLAGWTGIVQVLVAALLVSWSCWVVVGAADRSMSGAKPTRPALQQEGFRPVSFCALSLIAFSGGVLASDTGVPLGVLAL
mmetsp:Transcript_147098/g.373425  ORF Transcript_147098/g.373425 Transcript_147098/m.373425 type:complete len:104 (+) Transcript_147098:52-363(+)